MRKLFILLFLGLYMVNAQNLDTPIPVDDAVKVGKLENGLTYYIRKNTYPKDKVELRLAINAGSVLENEDQQGLAHFLEHMNFNGTKNYPKNEMVSFLQSIGVEFGADLNAYTSFDETVYMLPVPLDKPDNLDKGLLILEDWAFNALLKDEDINAERGVVLEEYRSGLGADKRMWDEWLPKVYKGSQYAVRLPIGKKEIVENFNPEVLRQFHSNWYRPNLMSVIVVGDIDVAEIEKKIKTSFGKYKNPPNAPERKNYGRPNSSDPVIAIASDKEASFTNARIMYIDTEESKPVETTGDYRNSLVRSLFSAMINNRLREIANGENPPYTFASCFYGGTFVRNKNAYQAFTITSPDKLTTAFNTVLRENERVKRHGFTASELKRAKAQLKAGMERSYNNRDKTESARWVGRYINNFLEKNPIPSLEWQYNMYEQLLPGIKLEEVSGLIDRFIHKDNMAVVVTGPEAPVTEAEVLTAFEAVTKEDIAPYQDASPDLVLMKEKPGPGIVEKIRKDKKMETTTLILSNGAKVVYKKTEFKDDEILLSAFSYGGNSLFTDEEWKKTRFAFGGLTDAGVNNISLINLNKLMSGKTVRVNPYIGTYTEGLNGTSSVKDFETMFQMIHLYFTSLNYKPGAFDSYKQKQQGFMKNMLNSPQFYFSNEFGKFLNSNNPRGGNLFPMDEDWAYTDYDLAYKKYKERFSNAGDFTFFFVGNIDDSKIKEYAETYLASLPSYKSKEKYKKRNIKPLQGPHEKIYRKGSDPKSLIRINFIKATKYKEKESIALTMLGDVLTIKLIEVLREAEGGVYSSGARGSISRGTNSSARATFNISIPTGVEQYEKMKTLAFEELRKLIDNGPEEEDLNKVKEALIIDRKEAIQRNRFWVNTLYYADYYGEKASGVFKYEDLVRKITAKDIQNAAKKYASSGAIVGILLPEESKEEKVQK